MLQINGTGIVVNGGQSIYGLTGGAQDEISEAGTSGGTVKGSQNTVFGITTVVVYFNNYVNSTVNNQTINYPYVFTAEAQIASNDTGLIITATTSGFTITSPNSATTYSGILNIVGI